MATRRPSNPVAGYIVVLDEAHATSVLLGDGSFLTIGRLFLGAGAPRPPVRVFRTRADAEHDIAGWPPEMSLGLLAVGGDGAIWRLRRQGNAP